MSTPRLAEYTQDQLTQHRSLDFCRWLSCLHAGGGPAHASELFLERYPRSLSKDVVTKSIELYQKAAVPPATTTDASWAAPLFGVAALAEGFLTLARSASLLGRIPNLRRIPFHVRVARLTQPGSFAWTGQNTPKPVTKFAYDQGVTLGPTKATGIIVVTAELGKLLVPGTELELRRELIAQLTAFTDTAFLDPASAAIADVRPASITNGLTPIAGTGDLVKDVGTLLNAFYAARPATDAVLIMSPANASALTRTAPGTMREPIVATEAAGTRVTAMDPEGVLVADNGASIDVSRQAAIEMVDNPAAPTAATVYVDLWQMNLVGYKVERYVNWQALPGAVAYLTTT